jgi:hypothetical protein
MTVSCLARPLATLAVLLVVAGLAGGCESRSRELQPGSYRAVIELPGGELPFGLEVARENDRPVLLIVNGEERLRVEDVVVAEGQVTAKLAGPGNTLTARVTGKRLEGEVSLQSPGGGRGALPFRAELGQAWRFFETPTTDNADVAGRWTVTFVGEQGAGGSGAAELKQSFELVTGRFPTPSGESGLLAGEMHGDELYLSRFDGASATLWRARVAGDGALVGDYWSGGSEPRRFRAVRSTAD